MRILNDLRKIFVQYLNENLFTQSPKELYEPNNYFLNIGGKRMRPVLVLLGSHLYNKRYEDVLPAAMAIEYFHNFSLIHDDIMDAAPLRRGQATIHEKYNSNTAILSGDALLVYAYKFLSLIPQENLKTILEIFSDTAIEVCEGQQLDMNFETQASVTEDEYIWMIRQKTSVVLAAAIKIGSLIGGASNEDAESLFQYALNLGIAFQIQDDILDCYGNIELVGKQPGGDIIQNKKTLLLIRALNHCQDAGDKTLIDIMNKKYSNSSEKIKDVLNIYEKYQIKNSVEQSKQSYIDKAIAHLDAILLEKEKKDILFQLTEYLVKRDY
ncbi:MAG: polyprenyl synthetase family protein [Chitinophagales bacterium]|nr:polyprenyl synthetase family protein [Chitinophagales bacterium]